MTLKPCLTCGELSDKTRCPDHDDQSRPGGTAVGYDWRWRKLSLKARRLQPWCTDCGATTDLTTDHLPIAWERHDAGKPIRLTDVEVVCRPCNSRRGAARPSRPGGKPQEGDTHTPLPRRSFALESRIGLNKGVESC